MPLTEIEARLSKLEKVVIGDPSNPESRKRSILGTMDRLNAWLDLGCLGVKAILAGIPAAGAFFGLGRTMGWW